MSGVPKRLHEEGGHSTPLKRPHEELVISSSPSGKPSQSVGNEFHNPLDHGQKGRVAKAQRLESREVDKRSSLLHRLPSASISSFDHPIASENRLDLKRDVKSEGWEDKEHRMDRGDFRNDTKFEKDYVVTNAHSNWKDSKEHHRSRKSATEGLNSWSGSRSGLQSANELTKDLIAAEERSVETLDTIGDNKVDQKVEEKFRDKDRKTKEREIGEKDKDKNDFQNNIQLGGASDERKDLLREERDIEKLERERKDLQKDKEWNMKDTLKRESTVNEKDNFQAEKEIMDGSVRSFEQDNTTSEPKRGKVDSWKIHDKDMKEKKREGNGELGERQEQRGKHQDKEGNDSIAEGDGTTEKEKEAFGGLQQRRRLRSRGTPQTPQREAHPRSRARDTDGSQGKSDASAIVYKAGECMQELMKSWKEFKASQDVQNDNILQDGPTLEIRIPAEYITSTNRQVKGAQLWGTDIYTNDSDLVAVLMHTGYISTSSRPPPGIQELRVTVRVLQSQECRRKPTKSKGLKFADKCKILSHDRYCSACKFETLKTAVLILTCCTVLTLVFFPTIRKAPGSRSRFVDAVEMWQTTATDPRYISHLDIEWNHLSTILQDLKPRDGNLRVGLLNFNVTEARIWQHEQPKTEVSLLHLDYADASITWDVLYPEWIDEEEENEAPSCPSLPELQAKKGSSFNLVAVKLPCDRSRSWNRDVARLHLQLSAAKLASGKSPVSVLILTECLPIPNLFSCKDLVRRKGNLWLYEPEPATLEEKLRLPIGSCELAIPFEAKTRVYTELGWRREAYATIIHSADQYVCGAIAAAKSIRLSGSARDLVILVDETISGRDRAGLESAGWKVRTINRIRNPKAKRDAYNEWNYSKFRLWQLTEYDKVVFLDADLLVLRNIDFLFALPEVSAIGNNATLFNSGVMVVEPSECTFQWLMDNIEAITSYNGGDQGYLNEVFTWWHRVPRHTNYLKHFWEGDTEQRKARKDRLFAADPPVLYVVHYLGLKPWVCYRDYDCNWDMRMFWRFASDGAHATWWRVHDTLPEELQRFCLLQTRNKAFLEYNRRQAEKEDYPDGHWRRNITDPRLHICTEKFCNWRSMLVHWGDTDAYPRSSKPSL